MFLVEILVFLFYIKTDPDSRLGYGQDEDLDKSLEKLDW